MNTKRDTINTFRRLLQENGADTDYTNKQIYNALMNQGKWLIKRDISAGRIYRNNAFFQTLGCQEIEESSTIDACCPVKVNCKIYRTKHKIPETWIDNSGPVIRSVTSVDGSTDFMLISPTEWQNKRNDPYQRMKDVKYAFSADGYIWFPEHNPRYVNIVGFYTDDISNLSKCADNTDCVRYLDTKFPLPDWLHAEMMSKALEQLIPSKKMLPDEQIDKNSIRRA